jgi:hypothetical protein
MRRSVREVGASALLLVLALCVDVRSQDKKPEPEKKPEAIKQDPGKPDAAKPDAAKPDAAKPDAAKPDSATPVPGAQQDRIDIGTSLDSWYKVLQGPDAVGYVHEVLLRAQAGNPWRYRYDADSEVELMLPDPKDAKKRQAHTESLRIRAQLDDTYAPINMERADNRDETQIQTSVITEENGKKIDVILGSADRKSHPVSGDEEVHYSRFLMFVSLRQNGKLAKAGMQRAMLFTPREDDKLPLSEVQIEVHEMVKKEYMGKKDVPVTRVTYLKPPPAPNRDAELLETFVDKFGRIVEETTRGGVRRILVKDEAEAAGTKERVRPGARRDPFRKDLAMMYNSKAGAGADIVREPPPDPTNMAATFAKMEALIEELRKAKEEKRDEEGQKAYEKFLDIQSAIRSLNNLGKPLPPEQMARVDSLRKQAEDVWGGLERLMKQLQGTYVRVIDAYNRDECDVMELGIGEFKKAQNRKELEDMPQLSQVLKWIGELEPLVGKCKTRIELGKKKLVLTGTMLHEDSQFLPVDVSVNIFGHQVGGIHEVRFTKPNRIAVINDKMYRVGDVVEGEGVRVEKIWAFGIQVSLREEVRDVGIRQK